MIRICAAAFVLTAALAAVTSAQAAGGCGWGAHRGPYGGCRANGGPVVVAPSHAIVVAPARGVVVAAPSGAVVAAPAGGVAPYVQAGRACPYGYHLGPQGHRCWPN